MAVRTPTLAAVERKIHMEMRERLGAIGYQVARFYKVFPPDRKGTVEILFRGYLTGRHPIKVEALTALVTGDTIAVRTGW